MITIIDFYADWCIPCKHYDVVLPELSRTYGFIVEKVNVEKERALADSYGVVSLPTLIIRKDGEFVGRIVGAYPLPRLIDKIEETLGEKLVPVDNGSNSVVTIVDEWEAEA